MVFTVPVRSVWSGECSVFVFLWLSSGEFHVHVGIFSLFPDDCHIFFWWHDDIMKVIKPGREEGV